MAFAAPARAKRSRTWRQLATYSWARLPLSPLDHGRQSPFISGAKRRSTGRRYAAISAAQRSISVSWSPARMRRSAYAGCAVPPSQSHGSHEMSGTAPRSLMARAVAIGKSGACFQSAKVPTTAGRRWDRASAARRAERAVERRLGDDDRDDRLLVGVRRDLRDAVDRVLAARHLADERVVGRQPRVLRGHDEELAPRCPGRLASRLGHRDRVLRVLEVGRGLL